MTLLTIPQTKYDRALHSLPLAVCDMQRGQPVNVRVLQTSGGGMLFAEPVNRMIPLHRPNGVVLEDVAGGHGTLVAAGQIEDEGNRIYVMIEGVRPADLHSRVPVEPLGSPPQTAEITLPNDIRAIIREIVREEIAILLSKTREDLERNV